MTKISGANLQKICTRRIIRTLDPKGSRWLRVMSDNITKRRLFLLWVFPLLSKIISFAALQLEIQQWPWLVRATKIRKVIVSLLGIIHLTCPLKQWRSFKRNSAKHKAISGLLHIFFHQSAFFGEMYLYKCVRSPFCKVNNCQYVLLLVSCYVLSLKSFINALFIPTSSVIIKA